MLDIKFIREHKDLIKEAARKKHLSFDVEELLKVDGERLEILKSQTQANSESLNKTNTKWQKLMLQVPNIPDMTVPEGQGDTDNIEIKVWGEKRISNFTTNEKVSKNFSGKGEMLKLEMAIWQYSIDFWESKGYLSFLTPTIIGRETLFISDDFSKAQESLVKLEGGQFLCNQSEVSLVSMFANQILENLEDQPMSYIGLTFIFENESRTPQAQFSQAIFCEASHAKSVELHEEVLKNTGELFETLEIPYRCMLKCGASTGQSSAKKYSIELWSAKENKYTEVSTVSYFHDFQTRRGNIKYRTKDGTTKYAHSLNCTAIPTSRILVSLIENYQNSDGSITIPKVLQKYMGGQEKIFSK